MSMLQELADSLARDVLAAQEEIGDDRFYEQVGKLLLEASPTLHEAFMTSIRVRLAEARGRAFLARVLQAKRAAKG